MAEQNKGMSDLWRRLRFVFMAIVIYRLGTHIPIPGIDPARLAALFDQNQGTILEMFNLFSGGALERMSIFALNVVPYISSAIIMQLFSNSIPYLQELKKDGQAGRNQITQYTRYGTVLLAFVQASALAVTLGASGLAYEPGTSFFISAVLAMIVIAIVVFIERGQRRITVNYAQRQQGRKLMQAQASHLPFKVNMAGVIPAIFASTFLLFPASLSTLFGQAESFGFLQTISLSLNPGQPLYILTFSALIISFCFIWLALTFDTKEVTDNLKKSGAFVPSSNIYPPIILLILLTILFFHLWNLTFHRQLLNLSSDRSMLIFYMPFQT